MRRARPVINCWSLSITTNYACSAQTKLKVSDLTHLFKSRLQDVNIGQALRNPFDDIIQEDGINRVRIVNGLRTQRMLCGVENEYIIREEDDTGTVGEE
jgi:hypothetical protein